MNCDEARPMLHALLDGELDARETHEIESHVAGCTACAAELAGLRDLRQAMAVAQLRHAAPAALRRRIEGALPAANAGAPSRRSLLRGFAFGAAASALAATGVVLLVVRSDRDQRILDDILSAHLRSLQAAHLTDVSSSDRDTVKPWFSGRLALAPPVADLAAQGFTLVGGRLDTIDGKAVAALVYRRQVHVINLFVGHSDSQQHTPLRADSVQGFNVGRWSDMGLNFVAISDIDSGELREFHTRYEAAARAGS